MLIGWHDIKTADTLGDRLLVYNELKFRSILSGKAGRRQFPIFSFLCTASPTMFSPKRYWLLLITQSRSMQQILKHAPAHKLYDLYDAWKTSCYYISYFQKIKPQEADTWRSWWIPVRPGHVQVSQLHFLVLDAEEITCLRKRQQRFVAFKTLPQHAVQTLVIIVVLLLEFVVYRTLKTGRSSLTITCLSSAAECSLEEQCFIIQDVLVWNKVLSWDGAGKLLKHFIANAHFAFLSEGSDVLLSC